MISLQTKIARVLSKIVLIKDLIVLFGGIVTSETSTDN